MSIPFCNVLVPPLQPIGCVEEICQFFGITGGTTCGVGCSGCTGFETLPVNVNSLYASTSIAVQSIPYLTEGLLDEVQTDLSNWFLRLIVFQVIPWFFVLLTLIIVLGRIGIFTFDVALMGIVLLIVLTVLALLWISDDVINVIFDLDDDVRETIDANLTKYGPRIRCTLVDALFANKTLFCPT
jgi:hypothetical protein